MAYTQDDYLKDMLLIQMDDSDLEAKARVSMYRAGRYDKLNAMYGKGNENSCEDDPEYNILQNKIQQIDWQISAAQNVWLYTPSGEHKLWNERYQYYLSVKDKGEQKKDELRREYLDKKAKDDERKRKEAEEKAAPMKVLLFIFIMLGLVWLFSFAK